MKIKKVSVLIFLFLAIVAPAGRICAQEEFPPPVGYVNDFGNFLSLEERKRTEKELKNFRANNDVRIIVITVSSLNGKSPKEYLEGYVRKWGIRARQDIIFLFARQGRKKGEAVIITGSGIRQIFDDRDFLNIVRKYIVPYIEEDKANNAIINGVRGIMAYLDKQSA